MKRIPAPLAILFVALSAWPMRADEITPAQLDILMARDVVRLGEVHDNAEQHENQARAVRAIHPSALVFEMLTPAQAEKITSANRSDKDALEQALDWGASGWPAFSLYFPIIAAAPEAEVFAGGVPRREAREAVKTGAAGVFGSFARQFGLTTPLSDTERAARQALQMRAHCDALPQTLLSGMVEAQRLRDATLAKAALAAVRVTGGPVVVITGNGHARRDWGMPRALRTVAPEISILSIGQYELSVDDEPPVDLYLLTSAAEREDPCVGFVPPQNP